MTIGVRKVMQSGDVMLLCSDGFWSPLDIAQLAGLSAVPGKLADNLQALATAATKAAAPQSDNTSAAAVRYVVAAG
jgi:serine/threonine protein phosphatase PrpC